MNPDWQGTVVLHPENPQAIGEGVGTGVAAGVAGIGVGTRVGTGVGVEETNASVSQRIVSSFVPPIEPQSLIPETSHLYVLP